MVAYPTTDRDYVSRFATDYIGVLVAPQGTPVDPDNSAVGVTMVNEVSNAQALSRAATRVFEGEYETQLTSAESSVPGLYTITWSWAISGTSVTYQTFIEIGDSAPVYDALNPTMRALVNRVWLRFSDLFDSPNGGPNLQTYKQAKWSRNRVAQLLGIALNRLNTFSQPMQTFTLDTFPTQWAGVLEQATYIECLKHLVRSYSEIPQIQGANGASRMDISAYASNWRAILQDETRDEKDGIDSFKIAYMGLGRASVLVAGGIYAELTPTYYGNAAARGYYPIGRRL